MNFIFPVGQLKGFFWKYRPLPVKNDKGQLFFLFDEKAFIKPLASAGQGAAVAPFFHRHAPQSDEPFRAKYRI